MRPTLPSCRPALAAPPLCRVSAGSGTTYTVTVTTGTGDGTIGLDVINDGSIKNASSTPLSSGYTGGQVYTIDRTAPAVSSVDRADSDPTHSAVVHFTVTFSESVAGVDAGDFSLTTVGVAGTSITNVSGSGATYTVTVDSGSGDGTIRLDVAANGTIVDPAGNALAAAFTARHSVRDRQDRADGFPGEHGRCHPDERGDDSLRRHVQRERHRRGRR